MRTYFWKYFSVFLLFAMMSHVYAQGIKSVRFNEIMLNNQNNYQDEFGDRNAWVEIFNSGYSTINVGGCYLTNDPENPTKYRIPKGLPNTILAPRSYATFIFSGNSDRGVFQVGFRLDSVGYLALYDQSGKFLIDSFSYAYPEMPADISFGIYENDKTHQWQQMEEPSPNMVNYNVIEKTRAEKFYENDRHGFVITLTIMSVVFLALLLLAIIFTFTGKFFKKQAGKSQQPKQQQTDLPAPIKPLADNNDDDMPAIAMTLHLYFDNQHEVEQTGFYLNPQHGQSPWGAKALNFRQLPK